jgi:hypothetical protein
MTAAGLPVGMLLISSRFRRLILDGKKGRGRRWQGQPIRVGEAVKKCPEILFSQMGDKDFRAGNF